jgi:plastocyanin
MRRFISTLLLVVASVIALMTAPARADVLLDETNLIGLPSVAAPSEYSFTASTAQALTLTLTDLALPAAFSSLQVAVTLGDALVGSATVNPATHTATLAIPAAAGNYTLDVIGTPNSTQGFGSFGVCVAPATSATSCVAAYSFSGNIQTPAATSSAGTSTLNTNFTSTVAGNYTVTLTDDAFPVTLQSLSAGILQGNTPISVGIPAGTPTQVTLAAGTSYELLVAAVANSTLPAGLYGIKITDPTGAAVFTRTLPVGTLPASTLIDNTTAQALTLSLTDYGYPAALAKVGVAVTEGAASLASLTAPGTVANFMAPAGNVEIWQYAVAGAQPGVYGVDLSVYQSSATGASLFSATKVVNPASVAATSYAFIATIPSAGTYNLVVNDFQFPSALQSVSATVAQNGTVLAQSSSGDFAAVQGPVVVLVDATPPQTGSGIFGVTVQTEGTSPQILLDQTQAVGAVFDTQTINLGTSGGYTVALDDLGFPQTFQNLAVVVSRGSQVLGKIYAGGTFQFTGIPSQYLVSIVATPGSDNYGLYSLNIASAAPTVTFSASPTSVTAGDTTTLTWSSQNATTCTAGGSSAWTGSESTSGTLAVVVTATETLTLTCNGPGGSASQSLSVTATAAPASSGGGGAVDLGLLTMLGGLLLTRRRGARPGVAVTEL